MKQRLFAALMGVALLGGMFFAGQAAHAQLTAEDLGIGGTTGVDIQSATGLSDTDPRETAARIINVALGILGIILTVLVVYAGFLWMTAGGNEDQIGKAKSIISAAVVGLVLILAAYGISNFVINQLLTATS